ncbi:MAG: hypothetical protein ACLRIS_03185 [Flavonifractor plautii]
MLAYRDDLSFRRIVNAPKRTWASGGWLSGRYAAQQGCSCTGPAGVPGRAPVQRDTSTVSGIADRGLSVGCEGRPVSECSPPCSMRAAMRRCSALREPGAAGQSGRAEAGGL